MCLHHLAGRKFHSKCFFPLEGCWKKSSCLQSQSPCLHFLPPSDHTGTASSYGSIHLRTQARIEAFRACTTLLHCSPGRCLVTIRKCHLVYNTRNARTSSHQRRHPRHMLTFHWEDAERKACAFSKVVCFWQGESAFWSSPVNFQLSQRCLG